METKIKKNKLTDKEITILNCDNGSLSGFIFRKNTHRYSVDFPQESPSRVVAWPLSLDMRGWAGCSTTTKSKTYPLKRIRRPC